MNIALAGASRSGKDETCKILINKLPNYRRRAFADPVKEEYGRATGMCVKFIENIKTLPVVRKQIIYTAETRKIFTRSSCWADYLIGLDNIIIPDLRFYVELKTLSKDCKKIRIECPREIRLERAKASGGNLSNENHTSETELNDYTGWDYIIMNDKTPGDLEKEVDKMIDELDLYKGFGDTVAGVGEATGLMLSMLNSR
jgi:dephospho-CoA kinase